MPHAWFLLRCFFVDRHYWSFSVVSKSLLPLSISICIDFICDSFHLQSFRFEFESVRDLTLLLNFILFCLKEGNNGIWFMILIWTIFFRLILIRAIPGDFDDTCHFSFTILLDAIVLSAFFLGVYRPFFLESVDALRDTSHPPYP